jgi:hypothetical protein
MGIEILENTLLKLLVRRGTDYDRQQLTLDSGELGYTTDTKRLFIGDGTTVGGNLVGNKYKGRVSSLTTLAPVQVGDYAYDTDNYSYFICVSGTGSLAENWLQVASNNAAGNETITVDLTAGIAVGTLSAGNFAEDALGVGVTLDSSNRITLSSSIVTNTIIQKSTDAAD